MTTAAEDRIAAIRRCVVDQGLSFDATAKALGLSLGQVTYSAKQGGIEARRGRPLSSVKYGPFRRLGRPPLPPSEKKLPPVKYGPFRPHWAVVSRAQKERNESIIALLREGVTCEAIGERFGVSRQRVHQIAMKAELVLPHSWKARRAENKRLLRAKRDAEAKRKADVRQKVLDYGLTFRATARALGLTPAQVAYTAKTVGIKSPQAPRKS